MNRKQPPSFLEGCTHAELEAASHFVYLLSCADGTLYTGYTTNVVRRLGAHNAGRGARYTRGRCPVTLVACWTCSTKGDALRVECMIKRLSHQKKLRLAQKADVGEESHQGDALLCALQ